MDGKNTFPQWPLRRKGTGACALKPSHTFYSPFAHVRLRMKKLQCCYLRNSLWWLEVWQLTKFIDCWRYISFPVVSRNVEIASKFTGDLTPLSSADIQSMSSSIAQAHHITCHKVSSRCAPGQAWQSVNVLALAAPGSQYGGFKETLLQV